LQLNHYKRRRSETGGGLVGDGFSSTKQQIGDQSDFRLMYRCIVSKGLNVRCNKVCLELCWVVAECSSNYLLYMTIMQVDAWSEHRAMSGRRPAAHDGGSGGEG
jgi:hypothetical protein